MNGLFAMRNSELRAAIVLAYSKRAFVTARRMEQELASRMPASVPMEVPNIIRINV